MLHQWEPTLLVTVCSYQPLMCNKCITDEVGFYFCSYEDFVDCKDDRLKAILSALNLANVGHYNDLRIKYPGFILEPPLIDINKVVQVIQRVSSTICEIHA